MDCIRPRDNTANHLAQGKVSREELDKYLTVDIARSLEMLFDMEKDGYRLRVRVLKRDPTVTLLVEAWNTEFNITFKVDIPEAETIYETMVAINKEVKLMLHMQAIRELAVLKNTEGFHVN